MKQYTVIIELDLITIQNEQTELEYIDNEFGWLEQSGIYLKEVKQ